MHTVLVTNMVPPYRLDVFNFLSERLNNNFTVVTCTQMEKGRQWTPSRCQFSQINLRGFQVSRGRFVSHVNFGITNVLNKLQPDVICVSGFTPTMLLAIWYAERRHIPFVLSMDCWLGADVMSPTFVDRYLRTRYVPKCSAGIAIGKKSRQWFCYYGLSQDKISISPLVPGWPAPSQINSFYERAFDILWCGHIDLMKGIDIFTEVVVRLSKNFKGLRVRVVGDGPKASWVRDTLRKNNVNAHFDGFLQADKLADVFSSARLFLFPTRFDTWGLVANEAAQCGTPILISPHAGAADDLVEDGVEGCVRDLNIENWTATASIILSDPESWKKMSESAHRTSCEFSTKKSAHSMHDAIIFARS